MTSHHGIHDVAGARSYLAYGKRNNQIRPSPSWPKALFQSEVEGEAIEMKRIFLFSCK